MTDKEMVDKKLYKLEVFGLRPKTIYLNMFTGMEGIKFNSPHNNYVWSYNGIEVVLTEDLLEPIIDFEI